MTDKVITKRAAVALLDTLAAEHPKGHQESKARRYIGQALGGSPLEVMFGQDEGSSANFWVHGSVAKPLLSTQIWREASPAAALWTKTGKDGRPLYGRHSSLRTMPQLRQADLVRFVPASLAELGEIVDQVLAASAGRVTP